MVPKNAAMDLVERKEQTPSARERELGRFCTPGKFYTPGGRSAGLMRSLHVEVGCASH